jgi:hypothetical protein
VEGTKIATHVLPCARFEKLRTRFLGGAPSSIQLAKASKNFVLTPLCRKKLCCASASQ